MTCGGFQGFIWFTDFVKIPQDLRLQILPAEMEAGKKNNFTTTFDEVCILQHLASGCKQ